MGGLQRHDVKKYKEDFGLEYYVETGTGKGISLSHALTFNFKENHSVEIYKKIYDEVVDKFINTNCNIHLGNSHDILKEMLPKLNSSKILFFLDAHFPGADYRFQSYGDFEDSIRLPLEDELLIISDCIDIDESVFIIDDLRIYEDGDFSNGNWIDRKIYGGNGIDFIYNIFNETHNIKKDYRDEGYIILTPKR